jgi:hypothetical protein
MTVTNWLDTMDTNNEKSTGNPYDWTLTVTIASYFFLIWLRFVNFFRPPQTHKDQGNQIVCLLDNDLTLARVWLRRTDSTSVGIRYLTQESPQSWFSSERGLLTSLAEDIFVRDRTCATLLALRLSFVRSMSETSSTPIALLGMKSTATQDLDSAFCLEVCKICSFETLASIKLHGVYAYRYSFVLWHWYQC